MRLGQAVRDDGPQAHLAKEGTPAMGGVVILTAIVVATLAVLPLISRQTFGLLQMSSAAAILPLAVLVTFGLLGFADDYSKATLSISSGLNARQKLFWQFAISIGFVILLRSMDPNFDTAIGGLFGKFHFLGWLFWPFAVILMVGMSNAVNITDGLDGLVGGLTAIAATAMLLLPMMSAQAPVLVILAATIGACLGFLWFNANPAKIFMGDTGSLALGGFLAAIAIQTNKEIPFLIITFLFVIEIMTVALQVLYFKYTKRKYGEGRRIWKMAPLHHHFELSGWPEQKVVVRFWILGLLFAFIGILCASPWSR